MTIPHLQSLKARRNITSLMKSVSEAASQTLVIDSDISLLSSDSEPQEIFIRIAYSSWNSRLWTLQEAVFAKKLVFHFSDQDIELETLLKVYEKSPIDADFQLPWQTRLPYRKLRWYLDFLIANRERSPGHNEFLKQVIEGRTTTDTADEPQVLANIVGIDQKEPVTSVEALRFLYPLGIGADQSLPSEADVINKRSNDNTKG